MRDILFRGKRMDGSGWNEGDLLTVPSEKCCYIMSRGTALEAYAVDPETVGQYTGLKDKNGKKIFEGDVVKFSAYGDWLTCEVEFVGGSFAVRCSNCSPYLEWVRNEHGCEVIGNIYDNPELMEEPK